jgi:hypothetical protein
MTRRKGGEGDEDKDEEEKEEWILKERLWTVRQRLSRIGINTNHKQGSISSFVIDFLLLLFFPILEGEKLDAHSFFPC